MNNKVIIASLKGYKITIEGFILNNKGKIIKGSRTTFGYRTINFRINKKCTSVVVHRLQAYQKYGDAIFEPGIEVRHLNGVKTDNSWDNIAIGTHTENCNDISPEVRMAKALYATSFTRKHNKQEIIEFYKNNRSYKDTMIKFGISSKGTLHFILNN